MSSSFNMKARSMAQRCYQHFLRTAQRKYTFTTGSYAEVYYDLNAHARVKVYMAGCDPIDFAALASWA